MSQQPCQVPTSSPSKSTSRRTTSGGGTTSIKPQQPQVLAAAPPTTTTRSLVPSPHFEDDPIVASHQQHSKRPNLTLQNPEYSEHAVAESEHISYDPSSAHLPAGDEVIPSFQPFFTLIEDSVTNEHHHPTVHYIFADDDADIIAEAALRSLEVLDPSQRAGNITNTSRTHPHAESRHHEDANLDASRLRQPVAGMREHYIILDIHPRPQRPAQTRQPEEPASASASGTARPGITASSPSYTYAVSAAASLSAEWQVLRTSITTAPTIGEPPSPQDDGLMLRIEGRGNTPGDTRPSAGREKGKEVDREREPAQEREREREREKESMEDMIERFQRRLEDIRTVLDAGAFPAGDAVEGLEE